LVNLDHKLAETSLVSFWIGTIFTALCLRIILKNLNKPRGTYNAWCWGSMIASSIIFCTTAFWLTNLESSRRPRFTLFLTTSHAPFSLLPLTDCIISPYKELSVEASQREIVGILLFGSETKVALNFEIINNPDSPEAIDAPEILVVLPKLANFEIPPDWSQSLSPSIIKNDKPDFVQFFSRKSERVMAGDPETFPTIYLFSTQYSDKFGGRVPIIIEIRAANLKPVFFFFNVIIGSLPDGTTTLIVPQLFNKESTFKGPNGMVGINLSTNR